MKTYAPRAKDIKREWHLINAEGKILGRLATQAAQWLTGKHKPDYASYLDMGDYVIVTNAAKVVFTGRKMKQKMYYHHTGYLGNLKELSLKQMMAKDPSRVIKLAVQGMLPKNKLRAGRLKRLKVFNEDQHPYADKLKEK